jgi:ElaB/YqjD/DUF883 family membrane-anchored ribosome-binding protein
MAAERDPGRPAGPDLTSGGGLGGSTSPTGDSLREGGMEAPGTARGGMQPGTGEVHGGLRTGPGGEQYGGLGFGSGEEAEGVRDRAAAATREFAEDVRDRAENLGARAAETAEDVRDRAERFASKARNRIEDVTERAEDLMGEGGLPDRIRENPLPALAIGFGLGYLLAGRGAKRGPVHFAKSKLRKALFGALTAAVFSEARGLVKGEITNALFGGDDDEARPRHRRPSHRERF